MAVVWVVQTGLVLLLAAIAGYVSFDWRRRLLEGIDYCVEHQQWDEVLAKAEKLPAAVYPPHVDYNIIQALFHTARLPYRMFSYPQLSHSTGAMIVPQLSADNLPHHSFGVLVELGRVSDAERVAIETLEMRPMGKTLKELATIKLMKRQTADARVMLNILRDDLLWGRWAAAHLRRLAERPGL